MLFQLTALTVVLFLTEDAKSHNEIHPTFHLLNSSINKSLTPNQHKSLIKNILNSNKPPKNLPNKSLERSTHRNLVPRKILRQLHDVNAEKNRTKTGQQSWVAVEDDTSSTLNCTNPKIRKEVREIFNENEKELKKVLKKSRWKEKAKTKLMNKYLEKQEREDDYQEQLNQLNKLYDLQNPQEEIEDAAHDAEIFRSIYTSVIQHQKTWAARFFKKFTHRRVKRDEEVICYKDLGCFRDEGPFDYLDMLPNSPEEINTMFLLHTNENPTREQLLSYNNITSILKSNFKSSRKTKVIIHGFGSSCHRVWVREMRTTFLNMEDLNIICVDWENGAATPNYVRAASNTRLVGTQVAVFLEQLQLATNLSLDDVHLIGFSLGAHVSGYAGQKLKGIGRISGLDPAGPLFESFPPNMRLDASDAKFVDVIHTNADSLLRGGLGAYDPMGHVDFYPNGGRVQKGCKNLFVGGVSDILWPSDGDGRYLCNHRRGYKYFMESVVPVCKFPAVDCRDYDTFLKGDCFPCNENCGNMGYYADKSPGRGQLFLATRDIEPFCANQYKVEIWHSGGPPTTDSVATNGRFDITFASHDGKNETINVTRDTGKKMEAGSRTVCIVVLHVALSIIANLHVQYTSYRGWISSGYNRWAIDKMSIMSTSGKIQSFCHRGLTMESGLTMLFPLVPGDCNPLDITLHPLPVPWPGIDYDVQNGAHVYQHPTTTSSPIRGGSEATIKMNATGTPLITVTEVSASPTQPPRGSGGSLSSSFSVIYSIPGTHSNHTKIDIGMKDIPLTEVNETDLEYVKVNLDNITETGLILNSNSSTSHTMSAEEYLAWVNAPPPNRPSSKASIADDHKSPTRIQHGNTKPTPQLIRHSEKSQLNKETQAENPSSSSHQKSDKAVITYSRYPTPNAQGEIPFKRRPQSVRLSDQNSNKDKRKEDPSLTNENNSASKNHNRKQIKDPLIREDAQVKDISENFSADFIFSKNHYRPSDSDLSSNTPNIFSQLKGHELFSNRYEGSLNIPVDFDIDSSLKIAEEPSYNSVIDGEIPFKERARAIKFDSPSNQNLQPKPNHPSEGSSRNENKSNEPPKQITSDVSSHSRKQEGTKNDFPHSSQSIKSEHFSEHSSSGNFESPSIKEKSESLQSNQFSYDHYSLNGPPLPPHFGPHTLPPTVLKPPRIESVYNYNSDDEEPLIWSPPSVRYYGGHQVTHLDSYPGRHRYFPRPSIGFQSYDEDEFEYPSASSYTHLVGTHEQNNEDPHFRSHAPFHFQQYPTTATTRPPKSSSRPFPLSLLSFGQKGDGSSFSLKRDKQQTSESRIPRFFPFLANRFTSTPKRFSLPTHLRAPPQNQNISPLLTHVATRRKGIVDNDGTEAAPPDAARRITKGSNGKRLRKRQSTLIPNSFFKRSLPMKAVSMKLSKGRSDEETLLLKPYKRLALNYSQVPNTKNDK